jgi:hypothetical protein
MKVHSPASFALDDSKLTVCSTHVRLLFICSRFVVFGVCQALRCTPTASVRHSNESSAMDGALPRGTNTPHLSSQESVDAMVSPPPRLYCCNRLSWRPFCALITLCIVSVVMLLALLLLFVYGRALVVDAVRDARLQMHQLNITRASPHSWTDFRMDAVGTLTNTAKFDAVVRPMQLGTCPEPF